MWDEVKDKLQEDGRGLSGGQQQRLCIARTIAVRPEVILFDDRPRRWIRSPRCVWRKPCSRCVKSSVSRSSRTTCNRPRGFEHDSLMYMGRTGGSRTCGADLHGPPRIAVPMIM